MIRLRPIRTQEEMNGLREAAATHGHVVCGATSIAWKQGKIVGGIGEFPVVNLWASPEAKGRDMLSFWEQVEAVRASGGARSMVVACSDSSPLKPYLERMSNGNLGQFHLYHVDLQNCETP